MANIEIQGTSKSLENYQNMENSDQFHKNPTDTNEENTEDQIQSTLIEDIVNDIPKILGAILKCKALQIVFLKILTQMK